jgi:hypothetical protein
MAEVSKKNKNTADRVTLTIHGGEQTQNESGITAKIHANPLAKEIKLNPSQSHEMRMLLRNSGISRIDAFDVKKLGDEAALKAIIENVTHTGVKTALVEYEKKATASEILEKLAHNNQFLVRHGDLIYMRFSKSQTDSARAAMHSLVRDKVILEDSIRPSGYRETPNMAQALGTEFDHARVKSFASIREGTSRRQAEIDREDAKRQSDRKASYVTTMSHFNPRGLSAVLVDKGPIEPMSKSLDATLSTKREKAWAAHHTPGPKDLAESEVSADNATSGANNLRSAAPKADTRKNKSAVDSAREIYQAIYNNPDGKHSELARSLVKQNESNIEHVRAVKATLEVALEKTNVGDKERGALSASLRMIQVAELEAEILKVRDSRGDLHFLIGKLDHLGGAKAVASFMYRQQRDGNTALVAEVADAVKTVPGNLNNRLNDVVNQSSLTGEQQKIVQAMRDSLTNLA